MLFKLYGIFIYCGSFLGGGEISVDLSQKGEPRKKGWGPLLTNITGSLANVLANSLPGLQPPVTLEIELLSGVQNIRIKSLRNSSFATICIYFNLYFCMPFQCETQAYTP